MEKFCPKCGTKLGDFFFGKWRYANHEKYCLDCADKIDGEESKNNSETCPICHSDLGGFFGRWGYYKGEKYCKECLTGLRKGDYKKSDIQFGKESIKKVKSHSPRKVQEIENNSKEINNQKKLLKSYLSETEGAETYNHFIEKHKQAFANCQAWPDYVKVYMKLLNNNEKALPHLAKLIMGKEKVDNYDFIEKQLKKIFKEEISKQKPTLLDDLKEIDSMSGLDFEEYLSHLFSSLGYQVKKTKASRDGGVDLILRKDEKTTLIQAKRYGIHETVPVSAVRDVYANAKEYDATELIVLTTAMNFSLDTRKQAKKLGVDLWNRDQLKELLRKVKMKDNG